ncbi:dual specificity protein phosphatase family protein [Leptothermofonsia sichuanensis E412]|uniref:beta-lactamase hydrolase domain-containing protein n=1 Tax=Leptothermofonsia sichuanensis TaxID=2917832 RepID=UPI001CA7977D|nr:sulfur transferase domain-containing protein [Leptothermofonsia sichuanensis]QZZ22957.1 dual specificity protein phosphatase family protein [Leptothermofonsia sichuanensis E412]
MERIRKINDDLAIAGQIALEQLPQIVQTGFRSVLNLRSPQETGFLANEQQSVERWQLEYVNFPLEGECLDVWTATQVLNQISSLPKPVLVHCDNAVRSAAIVLMHIATSQGATLDQALNQAQQLGLFRNEDLIAGDRGIGDREQGQKKSITGICDR